MPCLTITSNWRILEAGVEIVNLIRVEKSLWVLPNYIRLKLQNWVRSVEQLGIRDVRKIPGYHDELLKGRRCGQRSVRLSRSYRIIYIEEMNGIVNIIEVLEVNKHDY